MKLYPAVFTPSDGYITVTFPDVPGAITQGKDIEEAHAMAVEVLGFALEDYSEYPKATPIHELKEQYPDSDIALVSIDMAAYMRKYLESDCLGDLPVWFRRVCQIFLYQYSAIVWTI